MDINISPKAIFDHKDHLKSQTIAPTLPQYIVDDFAVAKNFLLSYAGSDDTFNTYRREVERFLQWTWYVHQSSIKSIKRQQLETYLAFTEKPPQNWIGKAQLVRFITENDVRIPNSDWRPYATTKQQKYYQMSQSGWKSLFAVLSSFYHFLIDEEYTELNPVAQIRQKNQYIRKQQSKQTIRRLSELQWDYVIETAEIMADEDSSHERTLFIMSCLYGMYLRISELVATTRWHPEMQHFHQDQDSNWWFKTVGKGNKERDISVSNAMLTALKRYRQSLNLTSLPSPRESIPLINKKNTRGGISSTRQIRRIVSDCFNSSVMRMQNDGFVEEAAQLSAATVHWLRHTGISDDVKSRPREHVRDDAGHGSSAITDRYIDIELRARHASAKKKTINNS